MMNNILFLFALTCLLISCAETATYYYESGEIKTTGKINSEGNWHGTIKQYYLSGEIQFIGEFLDGVQNESTDWYYENGKIQSAEYYANGLLEGFVIKYDSLGYKSEEILYLDNERVKYQLFDTTGKIYYEFIYLNENNLPDFSEFDIQVEPSVDTIMFGDTVNFRISHPTISKYQIRPHFSNGKMVYDHSGDTLGFIFTPLKPNRRCFFILTVQINDTLTKEIGRKKYFALDRNYPQQ